VTTPQKLSHFYFFAISLVSVDGFDIFSPLQSEIISAHKSAGNLAATSLSLRCRIAK